MRLSELFSDIPTIKMEYKKDVDIKGIAYDSRKVEKNFIFVCIKGFETDGHKYINSAIDNGAVAVVVQDDVELNFDIAKILVADSRKVLPLIANKFYGEPSKKLRLIGITGTNGKTTSTYLIESIFRTMGQKTGLIGTINYKIGDEILSAPHTTPESLDIQRLLAQMVQKGVQTAIMEVSSHALALERARGLDFNVAVFTNLTRDHLDFHKSFDAYRDAKIKLFKMLDKPEYQRGVINFDDPSASYFVKNCSVPILAFGINSKKDVYPIDYELDLNGTRIRVATPKGEIKINAKLRGKSNVYNMLTAIAVGLTQNIDLDIIKKGIEAVENVPGRFESVDLGQDFGVIVDYAHTPDALERLLSTVKDIGANRLICVFGCGGDRDRGKRPQMGEIASRLSHIPIITSDNPRTEEPEAIIADILGGVKSDNYEVIINRRDAIRHAIKMAQKGDVVVIAGKGHEDYQILGKTKIHFDDREEAAKAIKS